MNTRDNSMIKLKKIISIINMLCVLDTWNDDSEEYAKVDSSKRTWLEM